MKKIIFTLILIFVFIPNIKAANVNIKWMSGVFANQKVNGTTYYAQLGYIYVDGKIAYCIEPGVAVTSPTYEMFSIDTIISNQDQKQLLEAIYYYGYGYKDHTTREYYMATQELIWNHYNNSQVYFTTRGNYQGDIINIDKEKQVIMELVNKNNKKPSFDGVTVSEENNKKVILYDDNEVLENYEIYSKNINYEKQGNQLVFKTDNGEINLSRKISQSSFVYRQVNSQTLVTFGLNVNINSKVTVKKKETKNKLCIIKKDKDSKEIIKDKTVFQIKNLLDNTTNNYETINGEVCIDLFKGNYQLKEIENPIGYIIDKQVYELDINKDTNMDFYNQKIVMPKTGYKINKNSLALTSIMLLLSLKLIKKYD